jgi:peptidoglycan/xylan/chitin deacetylase (PgdA/CDA1 family)
MIGNGSPGLWMRSWRALCLALLASSAAQAGDCPGHPDALGTSRTLVVDPREHPRIGTMQYPETLPLGDREVVLTFDDGPLPRNSNQVLQILADQCVKATFFTIGRQAQANPEGVRKLAAAGHTIGTHTQDHPLSMNRMPIEKARQEIDGGIASVSAALADPSVVAPFFRIPGLLRAEGVEDYLASKGIQVWSTDFLADDWHHISSSRVYDIAMKRLEEKGKGVLLLHDIQARTVAALPKILHELKVRGYHIVHVVPATAERPATPTEPQQWQLHPISETVAISHWPKIPIFVFPEAQAFPAPVLPDFGAPNEALLLSAEPFNRVRHLAHGVPLPPESPWPRQTVLPVQNSAITLPAPAGSLFEIPEKVHAALQPLTRPVAHHAEQAPPRALATEGESAVVSAASIASERTTPSPVIRRGHGARRTHIVHAAQQTRHVAHAGQAASKHQAHVNKAARRPVRVAS